MTRYLLLAGVLLLTGWATTAYTVDSGLSQLPPEFGAIAGQAYDWACSKNVWAPLEQPVIVRLRAISASGTPTGGSLKVKVYSFFRLPWADVEVTWSDGYLQGMTVARAIMR